MIPATPPPPSRENAPVAPPCTLVLFGAGGDLTKRLLLPAIYNLTGDGLLDDALRIIGLDHNPSDTTGWTNELHDAIESFTKDTSAEFQAAEIDAKRWDWVAQRLEYQVFDFDSADAYANLANDIHKNGGGNVIFYLAVAARFFGTIAEGLGAAGLLGEHDGAFRRIVVEKPFGTDLPSAQTLNRRLLAVAAESQIYRIDHFLGKDAVKGLMALRFDNAAIDALLRREFVDYVQITAAETLGVEERGAFYETTGALRDMIPNHLFSLLTVLAMDVPASLDADVVRAQKTQLMRAVRPLAPGDAVRGQYGAGREGGVEVPAYRDEHRVAPDSHTETYAALALHIDNSRWHDVHFYLRTGKRLQRHLTSITVHLRALPKRLYAETAGPAVPNVLTFGIDPDQTLAFTFGAKAPSTAVRIAPAHATFAYKDFFPKHPAVGYESLLYECMRGDQTNFQRADTIEAGWAAIQPVIDAWAASPDAPQPYASGGTGPSSADALLARGAHRWDDLV